MLQDLEIESSGWPYPGMADRAPGGATGRASAALAAAPAALLVVVGGAAVVATAVVAPGRGQGGWWAFVLVLVAWVLGVAGLALAARSRAGDALRAGVAAVAVAVVAVIVAGHGLPSPALPLATSDRLAGRGLPAPVRYTALVLVTATLVALVIALAAVLAARGRTLRRFDQRAVLAVVVAVAVGVGAVAAARPAGRHWSEATTEHVARSGVDHTQSGLDWIRKDVADAQPAAAAGGTGRWQALWSAPASAQRQRVVLVPDTNVAVAILGRAQGGETGVAALDAATGEERWHYRLPEDGIDGVAVSGVHQRVVVLVGDVAVQLDLATGTVVRRTVLPADPVAVAHGEAPATWFAIVGEPNYSVDYGGVASSRKDVFGFAEVLVLQQRMLLDGQVAAGKVLTLDLSGETRTIEHPPATGCRYSAFYESGGSTAVLVRDGANGSCGPVEVGIVVDTHRTSVFDLDFGSPCNACQVADPTVEPLARFGLLLTFRSSREVRTVDDFLVSPRVQLPVALGPGSTATLLPGSVKPRVPARLVVEVDGQPASVLDTDGGSQGQVATLPGTAVRSVVTGPAWYRFAPMNFQSGRVADLDPRSLAERQASPAVPCSKVRGMSVAQGRLLVECDSGRLAMFAIPERS